MAVTISEALTDTITRLLAEIEAGEGLTLGAAGRALGGTDPSTVFRQIKRGSKSEAGEVVRLEATRIGSRWWTTRSALKRYAIALTGATAQEVLAKPAAKQKSNASERLKALGC